MSTRIDSSAWGLQRQVSVTVPVREAHSNIVVQKWTLVKHKVVNPLVDWLIDHSRRLVATLVLCVMLSFTVMPSFAQSISFDATILLTQVNIWIVIFLPILSIGMGINIAIALVEKVGESILGAFRHR